MGPRDGGPLRARARRRQDPQARCPERRLQRSAHDLVGLLRGVAAGSASRRRAWRAGDVYQISYLPMKLTGTDFTMIVGATLIISFLATISPARRAARMDPVDVLRYE